MSIGFIILLLALIPALWKRSGTFSILWLLGSGFMAFEYLEVLYSYQVHDYLLQLPLPIGIAEIGLSKLAAFFGVIFSIGLPCGILYGHFYLKAQPDKGTRSHLVALGILGLCMHALLWMRHALLFMFFWEIMSISSFVCIIYDRKDSLKAALNYIISMQIGAAFLLAGIAFLYAKTGSLDFGAFVDMPRISLYLMLIGFAFKAGFMPFASWLPMAHPVAPAHISGIMSALMIKTGLYGIILLLSTNHFGLPAILVFMLIALFSAFWGVIHAMLKRNIKSTLAYSSIENIGIIGIGLSVWLLGLNSQNDAMAALGLAGALMHIFSHSLFKALLFYLSGNVQLATGSLQVEDLGGLAKNMPRTALYFLVGTFAISALPLGNAFISELSIYFGLFSAMPAGDLPALLLSIVMLAALAFIGALALIAFIRLFGLSFLGEARQENAAQAQELPRGLRMSQFVLVIGIILSGVFGNLMLKFVKPLLRINVSDISAYYSLAGIYLKLSILLGLLLVIFGVIYLIRRLLVKETIGPTWGCGYQKPNPRMQYSSRAFTHPLSYFLKAFVLMKTNQTKPDTYFPQQVSYSFYTQDPILRFLVEPFSNLLRRISLKISKIQSGHTNTYIAWCLGFLIFLVIWILGFK